MFTKRPDEKAVDPTANVRELVIAAIHEQNALRDAQQDLLNSKIDRVHDLLISKETSIHREFALIEGRRVEQKIDTKTAVDAALSAAEKAVRENQSAFEKAIAKSETMAGEQARQQTATFNALINGLQTIMSDMKDRVVTMESKAMQRIDTRSTDRLNVGMVVGIAGVMVVAATAFTKIFGGV